MLFVMSAILKSANEFGLAYSEERINEFTLEDKKGKYRLLRLWHTAPKGAYARPTLQYELKTPDGRSVDNVTGQWLWSKARMEQEIANDNVVFIDQPDGTVRAYKKDHLEVGRTEKPTSFFDRATTDDATKELNSLLPEVEQTMFTKPTELIKYLISSVGKGDEDIILDFFAGSCTTAQAVLELNREDGGNRRFIMVQLPEPTGNMQFPTIAEIGKERIRRVVARMKKGREGQLALDKPVDMGFKAFKLALSNYRQWDGAQPDANSYARQAEMFADPLVDGWQPENVLYEVALKEGYGLNVTVEPAAANNVQRVADPDKDQSFYITLAAKIALEELRPLDLKKDDLFICRDTALDDETAANLAIQCRLKTI